jgi:DNA polymerase III beta subunit
MKIVANREALHRGFSRVGSIVTSTIQQPIYSNVKLRAVDGDIQLTGTDLEVGLTVKVTDCVVEKEGEVLLPPARIQHILGETPDEQVTITEEEGLVVLKGGDSEVRLRAEDPQDFDDLDELPEEGVAEIDPDILKYMVRRTSFATAPDKGRYALNGVLFVLDEEDNIELAAADGSRLALVRKKVSNPNKQEMSFIVPTRGVDQLMRLGEYGEEPVRFAATEKRFIAENDVGRLVSQLVEGQFPAYQEVIPSDSKVKVNLPVRQLRSAVRRAGFVTTDETNVADFCFGPDMLTIRAESPDVGSCELRIPVEYDGEEVSVALNPDFIGEVLAVVEREEIKMRFTDLRSPCVFKCGLDYTYVVSPVIRDEGMA